MLHPLSPLPSNRSPAGPAAAAARTPGRLLLGLLLAATLSGAGQASAQAIIRGSVLDASSGAPIPGAQLRLVSRSDLRVMNTIADSAGSFRFAALRPGQYILEASLLGYHPGRSQELGVRMGSQLSVELRLEPAPIMLREVPVEVAPRPAVRLAGYHQRLEQGLLGHFITRAEIERRQPSRLSDLLAAAPGLSVTGGGIGDRRTRCTPELYVDGRRQANVRPRGMPGGTSVLEELNWIHPSAVEGIEIYRGMAQLPAEFADSNSRRCGVIAVWTRSG
jgi:hypothetical protein